MALPFLLPYIRRNTLLACRQVTKNFKKGVDSILSNHFSNSNKFFAYNRYKIQPRSTQVIERLRFRFTFVNGLHFIKSFGDLHSSNPFMTQSISILVGRTHYDSPSIKHMLCLHGENLLRLHLKCNYPNANHFNLNGESILDELAALLHLVPNLKSLKITTIPFIWPSTFAEATIPHFPILNNLEFLEVDDNNYLFIVKRIVHLYGSQIRILSCSGRLIEGCELRVQLPNVRKLCVNYVSLEALQSLASFKKGRLPLENIKFRMFHESVEAYEVLQAFGAFSESLKELELVCYPDFNEVREFYGNKSITNEREWKCEKVMKRLGVFTNLKIITTEWKIVRSKWFIEFLIGKCRGLRELYLFCEYEGVLDELEEFKRVIEQVGGVEKVEWWVWERGRFYLRKTMMMISSIPEVEKENATKAEDTSEDLELRNNEDFSEMSEASDEFRSDMKTSKFTCCYQ
ncbi:unnamed protein product [Orchesella dallaii]